MTSIESIPAILDWVKVQNECLIKGAFESLHAGVEEDIRSFNAILELSPSFQVTVSSEISTIFVVSRRSTFDGHVEFQRRGSLVEIGQSGEPTLSVTPVFSKLGRCRWKFNDEELEQWQVRKMALEKLLFTPQYGV